MASPSFGVTLRPPDNKLLIQHEWYEKSLDRPTAWRIGEPIAVEVG